MTTDDSRFIKLPSLILEINLHAYIISSLFNPLALLLPLAHPLASSSLKITNRSFLFASPSLRNKLPNSFHQPSLDHSSLFTLSIPHNVMPVHCHHTTSTVYHSVTLSLWLKPIFFFPPKLLVSSHSAGLSSRTLTEPFLRLLIGFSF